MKTMDGGNILNLKNDKIRPTHIADIYAYA